MSRYLLIFVNVSKFPKGGSPYLSYTLLVRLHELLLTKCLVASLTQGKYSVKDAFFLGSPQCLPMQPGLAYTCFLIWPCCCKSLEMFAQKKLFFFLENEVWFVLIINSKAVLDFWGPAQCQTLDVLSICAELNGPEWGWGTEWPLICCLLLVDLNRSELCLTLFDTWLEKEEENFPDGSKGSYFSFLKPTVLSDTVELAQLCTLGLNCVVVKAKCFLWGWSPICGWSQVKGLRDSDTSFFYITLFKHSRPGTIPLL